MRNILRTTLAAAVVLGAAACSDTTSTDDSSFPLLNSAFESTLAGFSNTYSSYFGADSLGFVPGSHMGRGNGGGMMGGGQQGGMMGGGRGSRGGMNGSNGNGFMMNGGGGMMGGGLHGLFNGDGFGGFGHGRFGDASLQNCAFNATTNRLECAAENQAGLTVTRSVAYTSVSGAVQQAFDSVTTNTINVKASVNGSHTRRDGAVATVSHTSDRTVTGLAAGSTQRTVTGTASGKETTTGTNANGAFTSVREMSDVTTNVVIPFATTTPTYPTAGKIERSAKITLTQTGGTTTSTRTEVITYDGTATAKVVITVDGTSKTCTLPLPRGRLACN